MPLYPCWAWGVSGAVQGERADEDVRDPRADEDVRAPGADEDVRAPGVVLDLGCLWGADTAGLALPLPGRSRFRFFGGGVEESPDTIGQRASRKRGTGFREEIRTESAAENKPPFVAFRAMMGKGEMVG